MKIRKILSLTFLALCICSCSESKDVDEVSLKGQLVKLDEGETGRYSIRYLFNDMMFVQNARSYDISVGKLSNTELQETDTVFVSGHGHNEFGYLALSQDIEGTLYILDRPFNGTKLISLTKIKNLYNSATIKDQTMWEKFIFDRLPPLYQLGEKFVVLSDSTILVTGAPANNMCHIFSIVNFRNQTVTPLDYWPDDGGRSDRISEKLQGYTYNSGILWNGKDRFVYWNGWGPLAFIFTIEGTKTNIMNYMYSYDFPNGETPTQRVYCCADSNRVYLLYKDSDDKGVKLEKIDAKFPFPMGNTVVVYDWDGIRQQVIHLDKVGREIMLSNDGKTLYLYSGYMDDGDEYIYSYKVR